MFVEQLRVCNRRRIGSHVMESMLGERQRKRAAGPREDVFLLLEDINRIHCISGKSEVLITKRRMRWFLTTQSYIYWAYFKNANSTRSVWIFIWKWCNTRAGRQSRNTWTAKGGKDDWWAWGKGWEYCALLELWCFGSFNMEIIVKVEISYWKANENWQKKIEDCWELERLL